MNDLIFPLDFYILDMKGETSSSQIPLILGRPFLKIARMKIDMHTEMLTMEFSDTMVQFNIFDAIRYPIENHSLLGTDVLDELDFMELDNLYTDLEGLFDCLDILLSDIDSDLDDVDDDSSGSHLICDAFFDAYTGVSTVEATPEKLLLSVVQPPKIQLKPLPDHLKYACLGTDEQLLVIIA